jgi:hypothetical protein
MNTFRKRAQDALAEIDLATCLDKPTALRAEMIGVLRRLDMWSNDIESDRTLMLSLALCDTESGTFSIDELIDLLEEEQHARGI